MIIDSSLRGSRKTGKNIKKLMKNLSFTAEKAMEALDVPKGDYDKFKAML